MKKTVTMYDPPGGWRFGFPRHLPDNADDADFDFTKWLLDCGYPEKDLEIALKHSRYWKQEIEE